VESLGLQFLHNLNLKTIVMAIYLLSFTLNLMMIGFFGQVEDVYFVISFDIRAQVSYRYLCILW
jgi:hypothetical protein